MPRDRLISGYTLSDDSALLQPDAIFAYLSRSYWAKARSRETVDESLRHSYCIGIYAPTGAQVGLVRVVTDYTTFAYLCDVYVLEEHRGQGLSKAALEFLLADPRIGHIRRLFLLTADAHGLYAQFGFVVPTSPERYMERIKP